MGAPFNADEVFEMAERIERNGGRFYRAAAEKFPAVRELLLELAEMEDDHERTFANMRAELSTKETAQTVFDPDGHIFIWLHPHKPVVAYQIIVVDIYRISDSG